MGFKTVERVSFLYEELKKLDAQISAIDELALYLCENDIKVSLWMGANMLPGDKPAQNQEQDAEELTIMELLIRDQLEYKRYLERGSAQRTGLRL